MKSFFVLRGFLNLVLFSVLSLLISCNSGFLDNDDWGDIELENSMSLSLAKGQISIDDLLTKVKSSKEVSFENGVNGLTVVYDKEEPLIFKLDSLLKIETIDFNHTLELSKVLPSPIPVAIKLESVPFNFVSSISTGENEQLDSAKISDGRLVIDIQNYKKIETDVEIELPTIMVGGRPLLLKTTLRNLTTNRIVYDLKDAVLKFDNDQTSGTDVSVNVVLRDIDLKAGLVIDSGDVIRLDVSISDLDVYAIYGDLGTRNFDIKKYEYSFGDYLGKLKLNNIHLGSPRILLNVKNAFGVDLRLNLDKVFSSNKTESKYLEGSIVQNGIAINGPKEEGVVEESIIEISNENSNLFELLEILPNSLVFDASIINNPDGDNLTNFISKDSYLELDPRIEVPLDFSLEEVSYEDTTKVNIAKVLDRTEELKIKKAILEIQAKNTLPLDLEIDYVYLLDEDMQVMDSLKLEKVDMRVFKASNVDENGFSTEPKESKARYLLPNDLLFTIQNVKHISYKISSNTLKSDSKKTQDLIKIRKEDNINLVFGLHILTSSEVKL